MGDSTDNHRANPGPRVIKITKAGWLYIAVTLFLGFSAVNTGNNLLFLIVAAFLSFMGISGFFGKRNLSKIDIAMEFPDEIYAKTSFPLKITLLNSRMFLPAFLVRVRVANNDILFPFVDAKSKGLKHMNVSFDERGRIRVEDIHICSVFPFNFFVRCRRIKRTFETIVFPQLRQCELSGVFEKERKTRGEKSVDRVGYETDILSVRDYIKGDPFKYIHWKASAKTGQLKTKELSSLSNQPIIIDFEAIPIKNVEEKISCITYIILKFHKHTIPVGLKIRGAVYKPFTRTSAERTKAGKITMLKALALYDKE